MPSIHTANQICPASEVLIGFRKYKDSENWFHLLAELKWNDLEEQNIANKQLNQSNCVSFSDERQGSYTALLSLQHQSDKKKKKNFSMCHIRIDGVPPKCLQKYHHPISKHLRDKKKKKKKGKIFFSLEHKNIPCPNSCYALLVIPGLQRPMSGVQRGTQADHG